MGNPDRPTRWETEIIGDRREAYIERVDSMYGDGTDLQGEARFVDALAGRGSRILDAGCGTGRVAAALVERGHLAVGVDRDAGLLAKARERHPQVPVIHADLLTLTAADLRAADAPEEFDVIVAAGNVMVFLAPGTERAVLANLRSLLAENGWLVVGFATDRAYTVQTLIDDAETVGLAAVHRFSTWHLDPWHQDSSWATIVLRRADGMPTVPGEDQRWA